MTDWCGLQEFQTPFFIIWQCIAGSTKAQAHENSFRHVALRSFLHPKYLMCTPLTLIRAHQAERVYQPWQKDAGSRIKPPGTDQHAVPGSTLVRANSARCKRHELIGVPCCRIRYEHAFPLSRLQKVYWLCFVTRNMAYPSIASGSDRTCATRLFGKNQEELSIVETRHPSLHREHDEWMEAADLRARIRPWRHRRRDRRECGAIQTLTERET
jgi:hypothetical protein